MTNALAITRSVSFGQQVPPLVAMIHYHAPLAVLWAPLAVLWAPLAVLWAPLAVLWAPLAVLWAPLAVLWAPITPFDTKVVSLKVAAPSLTNI